MPVQTDPAILFISEDDAAWGRIQNMLEGCSYPLLRASSLEQAAVTSSQIPVAVMVADAEIGPVPSIRASEYLLRVNHGSGPPGSQTRTHSHPGSEAFYVIAGETTARTADGVMRVAAGRSEPGHAPGTPMQVSSTGTQDLQSLVMFVVDADKPFSSPARLP